MITNINDSPEAHAEVDAMAQEQAREVSVFLCRRCQVAASRER